MPDKQVQQTPVFERRLARSRSRSPSLAEEFDRFPIMIPDGRGSASPTDNSRRASRISITDVFTAIIKNEETSLNAWLENGDIEDVNILYKGCCATHHAAYYGRVELLKKLASHGADFRKKNRYGETALDAAKSGKHAETIAFLEAVLSSEKDDVFVVTASRSSRSNAANNATAATANNATANATSVERSPAAAEVGVACQHLATLFAPALGQPAADAMAAQLGARLVDKFANHWFPQAPTRGTGFRCISSTPGRCDPLVGASLCSALKGLAQQEAQGKLAACKLPGRGHYTIWIDPGHVSVRVGDVGHITTIHGSGPATPPTRHRRNNNGAGSTTTGKGDSVGDHTNANANANANSLSPVSRVFTPPGLRKGLVIHDH